MTIKFTDAAKFFIGEPQQIDAFEYLQAHTSPEVVAEFERLFRNKPTITSKIPQQAIDIIKQFEGFSEKTYYDPATGGLPITAAYGSTRKMDGSPFYIGETITKEEGEKLLIYQLERDYLPALQKIPYWNEMNDNQKSALLDFGYNLGANFYGSSGFNTITQRLKNKEWNRVPDALMLYVNPGSNVETGLRRRRTAEGSLWNKK